MGHILGHLQPPMLLLNPLRPRPPPLLFLTFHRNQPQRHIPNIRLHLRPNNRIILQPKPTIPQRHLLLLQDGRNEGTAHGLTAARGEDGEVEEGGGD